MRQKTRAGTLTLAHFLISVSLREEWTQWPALPMASSRVMTSIQASASSSLQHLPVPQGTLCLL